MHWEEEKKTEDGSNTTSKSTKKQENAQLELEDIASAAVEEVTSTPAEGGASKEMGHSVSDDIKAGLVSDDPWLQRKLLKMGLVLAIIQMMRL